MKVYDTEQSQIIQIDNVIILTRDTRQMACGTITIHLDTLDNTTPEEVSKIVKEKMHWMGHIFFSQDIIAAKASFSGAVRLATDKILAKKNIRCTRIHIAEVKILL